MHISNSIIVHCSDFIIMPQKFNFSMGVVEHHGLIYIVGGCTHSQRHLHDLLCYNPVTGEWQNLAPMLTPRSQMGVSVLDGFLYVVGGTNRHNVLTSVERYSFEQVLYRYSLFLDFHVV